MKLFHNSLEQVHLIMEYVDTRPPNVIDYIFDRGWNTRLAPCVNRWLLKQFRKGCFQLKVLRFKKNLSLAKFEKLRLRYYWDNHQQQYEPLMQAVSLLHEKYKVPYSHIRTEGWFEGLKPDIVAQLERNRHIIIELGTFDFGKLLFFIYSNSVSEFWHDGKSYFYCLSMKSKPKEGVTDYMIKYRWGNKCAHYCACSPYLDTFSSCQFAWHHLQNNLLKSFH